MKNTAIMPLELDWLEEAIKINNFCRSSYDVSLTLEEALECQLGLLDEAEKLREDESREKEVLEKNSNARLILGLMGSINEKSEGDYKMHCINKYGLYFEPAGSGMFRLLHTDDLMARIVAEKTKKIVGVPFREYVRFLRNADEKAAGEVYGSSPKHLQEMFDKFVSFSENAAELGVAAFSGPGNLLNKKVYFRNPDYCNDLPKLSN